MNFETIDQLRELDPIPELCPICNHRMVLYERLAFCSNHDFHYQVGDCNNNKARHYWINLVLDGMLVTRYYVFSDTTKNNFNRFQIFKKDLKLAKKQMPEDSNWFLYGF